MELEAKGPRTASNHWFAPGKAAPNATENLFLALLVLTNTDETADDRLLAWAYDVLRHEPAYEESGLLGIPSDWRPSRKVNVPEVYSFICEAYAGSQWTGDRLDTIGACIQQWQLTGRHDGLQHGHLQHYRTGEPRGPVVDKKTKPPPRWKTPQALFGVANLIIGHLAQMRGLLGQDVAAEAVETTVQQLQRLATERDAAAVLAQAEKERRQKAEKKAGEYGRRLKLKSKAATDARKAERKKMAALSKQQRKSLMARAKAARKEVMQEQQRRAEEAAAKSAAAEMEKLRERLKKARARARAVEDEAKTSRKRLKRAQNAESALKEAVAELQMTLEEPEEPEEEIEEKEKESPTRDARGRWKKMPQKLRILIWAELARRVAPSAVSKNVFDAIFTYAPDTNLKVPCEREIAKMRGELTVASEAIAAFRVALCKRIISFGWDESTKFGLGLLSSNTQIETQDGQIVDAIMRGATLTAGGTAEAIAWSVDKKIFTHARELLTKWKAAHENEFGEGSWAQAGGPEPDSIGIHRLSEESLLMSDTCNAARKCKRLVAEAALKAGREKMGEVEWNALTEQQRDAKCKVYIGQCHQHLRNIIINAMQLKATECLKERLGDSLAEFTSYDRMSVDGNDLIRAIYKELHGGGAYAKGKGREFVAWVKKHYTAAIWMPLERAEGSRQDLVFDGSVPIFIMRPIVLEFLRGLMVPGANNQLEKFLLRVLSCNEMTAMLRVNTLWHYIFSRPTRFLRRQVSIAEQLEHRQLK